MHSEQINDIVKCGFKAKKVIVIGDLMVDEYIMGKVARISPEAPVPVLNYKGRDRNAGGASNVAINLSALGAEVSVSGVVGNDESGSWLRKFLEDKHISTDGIYVEENRLTTLKTRFATKGQQLLRMDMEDSSAISKATSNYIEEYVLDNIDYWDAVVLSDYCKGVFENEEFVKNIIKICNDNQVIVTIDSKSRNISAFKNADFVKPNNLELENAVDIKIIDNESFERAGERYLELSGAKSIIVTRGAAGISIFEPCKSRRDYAAKAVQVFDVTGAGDTVISAITLGLTSGLSIDDSVELANIAAGVVIGKRGTATVSLDELLERIDGK
jgi:D-beta-D-heptose 7-phosphate kinase/D-beta-D-heptose 1-phosphate adenosyltransferase